MSLFQETGHGSLDERNSEAFRLIDELSPFVESMSSKEAGFVQQLADQKERLELRCSAKQLFWLRDLYERYCL